MHLPGGHGRSERFGEVSVPPNVEDAIDLGPDQKAHGRYRKQKGKNQAQVAESSPTGYHLKFQQHHEDIQDELAHHQVVYPLGIDNLIRDVSRLVSHPNHDDLTDNDQGAGSGLQGYYRRQRIVKALWYQQIRVFDGVAILIELHRFSQELSLLPVGWADYGRNHQEDDFNPHDGQQRPEDVMNQDFSSLAELADFFSPPDFADEGHQHNEQSTVETPQLDNTNAIQNRPWQTSTLDGPGVKVNRYRHEKGTKTHHAQKAVGRGSIILEKVEVNV